MTVDSTFVIGTQPVWITVTSAGNESPTDWQEAEWAGTVASNTRDALLLIGPGTDMALTPGRYWVWVKIQYGAEVPVLRAGELTIT